MLVNFGSTLTARVDLSPRQQIIEQYQQEVALFQEKENYSAHSSSPVTQGFTSTRNSNYQSVESDIGRNTQQKENNNDQNVNELNRTRK